MYLFIAIAVVLVLLQVLIKLKVLDPEAFFRRLQIDTNTIVCLKQLGALLQIVTLLCSVVLTPAWYGKLSNALDTMSLPIQINSPCAPVLQSQPKHVQGIVTILLISVVTVLMAIAPFVPFVKSRLAASTTSKIQKLAGVVVGQSALVCISATLEQLSKTPFHKTKLYVDAEHNFNVDVKDDRDKIVYMDVYLEVTIAVIFIWGVSTLYSRAVAKFEERRKASDSDQITGEEARASMLPFYSTFCMPYVRSARA